MNERTVESGAEIDNADVARMKKRAMESVGSYLEAELSLLHMAAAAASRMSHEETASVLSSLSRKAYVSGYAAGLMAARDRYRELLGPLVDPGESKALYTSGQERPS